MLKNLSWFAGGVALTFLASNFLLADVETQQDLIREQLGGHITITIGYDPESGSPVRERSTYSNDPIRAAKEGLWNEDVVIVYQRPDQAVELRNKILDLFQGNR